jgi:predicted CoA-binding protein
MKTLVIGASENTSRYSNIAINMLAEYKHEVVGIGSKAGNVAGVEFGTEQVPFSDIDTVTIYVGPQNQENVIPYVLDLKPRRIIFNPGTENQTFAQQAEKQGIEVVEACTLVMLRTGQF